MPSISQPLALTITSFAAAARPRTLNLLSIVRARGRRRDQFLPAWNRRWLTLENKVLHWYRKKSSLTPSGSLDLTSVTSVTAFERGEEGVFSFVVRARDRNLMLRVESAGEPRD